MTGLLALMLLTEARRAARMADGELVPLHEQDRGALGPRPDRRGPRAGPRVPGAAPSRGRAVPAAGGDQRRAHRRARRRRHRLVADRRRSTTSCTPSTPSPIVALNRAVAVAELDGPEVGAGRGRPPRRSSGYHAWHATRADLLRRLGRSAESRAAYDAALGPDRQRGRAGLPVEASRPARLTPRSSPRDRPE